MMTRITGLLWPIMIVIAVFLPILVTDTFYRHVFVFFCIFAIYALGLNFIMGYIGELPFGFAAFWGLGAYASALLGLKLGLSFWVALPLGACVAALAGFIIGYLTLRLTGAYFAIVTLAFAEVLRLVCRNWVDFTRGPMGLIGIQPPSINLPFIKISFVSEFSYYYIVALLLLLTIFITRRFLASEIGRAMLAVRENESLARSMGINSFKYKILGLCTAAFFAGIAGGCYGYYVRTLDPNAFGMYYTGIVLLMIVVGGQGTIVGPLIGAAFFALLPEFLRLAGEMRMLIFGAIMVLVIIFMPRGIWPAMKEGAILIKRSK